MHRRNWPAAAPSPLRRIAASVLLAIWLCSLVAPGTASAAFASTDVVLVVDVSGSMDFPAEIPQDFPNRDKYQTSITKLINFIESDSQERTVRDIVDGVGAGIQLSQLQGDVDRYLQTHNITLEDLSRLSAARRALKGYLDLLELSKQGGTNDRVSLVTFDSALGANQALTGNFATIRTTLDSLAASGGTNMGAGLQAALDQLARSPGAAGTRQQIILLTDGFNNEGMTNEEVLNGPAKAAKARNIPIYTVGLGLIQQTIDSEFLADLASATGGAYVFADSPDKLAGTLLAYQGYTSSRVLARYQGELRAGQSLKAGTVEVPSGSQSLRMSYRVSAGTALDVSLTRPDGRVLTKADLAASLQKQGDTGLLTIANPPAGRWEVNLSRADGGKDTAQYTLTAATEGRTTELPIALATRLYETPEGWRPYLIAATVVIGLVGVVFIYLTFRGLFNRRASTCGGCFSGCFTVLLVVLIALGWGGYWLWNQPIIRP